MSEEKNRFRFATYWSGRTPIMDTSYDVWQRIADEGRLPHHTRPYGGEDGKRSGEKTGPLWHTAPDMTQRPLPESPEGSPWISRQRIVRIRRDYNRWVADETLEDYALRFTARRARRWSGLRIANTALSAISFLALEAIGGTITVGYGFTNAVSAIFAVGLLIFLAGLPISLQAARAGVDIDLLTRGAGFGYIGSTITSLIYASFTFLFFALESVILASMLKICFGIPLYAAYLICSVVVIPVVVRGISAINRVQLWTQPLWLVLHCIPFIAIALNGRDILGLWVGFAGISPLSGMPGGHGFDWLGFGAAASIIMSLITQIGEQIDYLRFIPAETQERHRFRWTMTVLAGGAGWIFPGMLKMLAGSFLAVFAIHAGIPAMEAIQPAWMYRIAFGSLGLHPAAALFLAALFVFISQFKINVTNAYAGSIAWSNFFSRLTHAHPGRVVWLIFNIAIALALMELGVFQAIEATLHNYSSIAAAWMGALVSDLTINRALGLAPRQIEFKRAHLPDVNPVGVGAMLTAITVSLCAQAGWFGVAAGVFSPFLGFATAFAAAPVIAWVTGGKTYLARKPRRSWAHRQSLHCVVCENDFEPEDSAYCPAYGGAICSLCCSLDARCDDLCKKPETRLSVQWHRIRQWLTPTRLQPVLNSLGGRYCIVFAMLGGSTGLMLLGIYHQTVSGLTRTDPLLRSAFWQAWCVMLLISGIAAWLLVLALQSRHVAREESRRQTALLMNEIRAHRRTDAKLQKAKEAAESANLAKSRFVVGASHELRSPLNAILGYAQLMDGDETLPLRWQRAIGIMRRSGEHLAGLIEGLLDISKIEAGRIDVARDAVRLGDFLDQIVSMFRIQAEAKGIDFIFDRPETLPDQVYTDERRLRQILINLLSNAIKFTRYGRVTFRVRWRSQIADLDITDTGIGIDEQELERIFEPFHRTSGALHTSMPGIGLGLTITKLLVQILGGDITVQSKLGEGSTFHIRLMLSEVQQNTEAPAEALHPTSATIAATLRPGMTAIIADDDPVHRDMMSDILAPLGITAIQAVNGQACLELAEEQRRAGNVVALFLLDIQMPGLNGWEVARYLRETGFSEATILIISANSGAISGGSMAGDHHDGLLSKPVDISMLYAFLHQRLHLQTKPIVKNEPLPIIGATALPQEQGLTTLDTTQRDALRQLLAIGYMRGLRNKMEDIATTHPDTRPDIDRLRHLADQFDLNGLSALLDHTPAGSSPLLSDSNAP
ncbi:Sensor protein luxQ [Granulibacter bethesdensis]|uniref:histidine kinase n=2 Tax=Granulibacter bethesdensis TaxID=364410 RepID=A0AAN0REZ8_9PROT|nr:Sensor protein luxQ [Granulibacter bethesdensis]